MGTSGTTSSGAPGDTAGARHGGALPFANGLPPGGAVGGAGPSSSTASGLGKRSAAEALGGGGGGSGAAGDDLPSTKRPGLAAASGGGGGGGTLTPATSGFSDVAQLLTSETPGLQSLDQALDQAA